MVSQLIFFFTDLEFLTVASLKLNVLFQLIETIFFAAVLRSGKNYRVLMPVTLLLGVLF